MPKKIEKVGEMEFIKKKLPKIIQKSSTSCKEIEIVVKIFPMKKTLVPDNFICIVYQTEGRDHPNLI